MSGYDEDRQSDSQSGVTGETGSTGSMGRTEESPMQRRLSAPTGSMEVDMTFTPSELAELARFMAPTHSLSNDNVNALSRDSINALVRRAIGNQMFISEAQANGDEFLVKSRGRFGKVTYRRISFL